MDEANEILWSARDVSAALRVPLRASFGARGVAIDSRSLEAGDLFVALPGEQRDGHAYVADAFKRGAAAALVSRSVRGAPDRPLVRVRDTLAALWTLARHARARTTATLIGITGSSGKTSVKDGLGLALRALGPTSVAAASHNNHIGVPLSLARLAPGARFGVFELGMNRRGEIARLAHLLRPSIGAITNISPAHQGFFDSLADIAAAKAELFGGLGGAGIALLPASSLWHRALKSAARRAGVRRIVSFAMQRPVELAPRAALVWRSSHRETDAGVQVAAQWRGTPLRYRLPQWGAHAVANSLAVLAAVAALGEDVRTAAEALHAWQPPPHRGARHRVRWRGGEILLMDDTYNANPGSMAAGLAMLGGVPRARRIAVLGDMLELGLEGPRLHRALAPLMVRHRIAAVYGCGPLMEHLLAALPRRMRGGHCARARGLLPLLRRSLRAGDVVLLKGSRAMGLDVVLRELTADARRPPKKAARTRRAS